MQNAHHTRWRQQLATTDVRGETLALMRPFPSDQHTSARPALAPAPAAGVCPCPAPLRSPILVDREAELNRLIAAAARPPSLVLVEGEAGVGKSRLVEEALAGAALAGRRQLVTRCHAFTEPLPFGPIVDAMRTIGPLPVCGELPPLLGALRPLLPELAGSLPPAPPRSSAAVERQLLFRAVVEMLKLLGPTVFVIEDLHWSDETSADFLRLLVAEMPRDLALILTYRWEELPPTSSLMGVAGRRGPELVTETIKLSPLSVDGVRRLIAAILQSADVSEEFAGFLHDRTGGLPFAIEEVLRLIQDRHDIIRTADGRWNRRRLERLEVPAVIRDSVVGRAARLSFEGRRMLDAAAVLDVPDGEDALAAISGLDHSRATRGLSDALASGMIVELDTGGYAFRHVLARQAVYEAMAGPDRRGLHDRAVDALRGSEPLPMARLAHHARQAGRVEEWVGYAEAVADLARSVCDVPTAAWYLREALEAPGVSSGVRVQLAVKLATAASLSLHHLDDVVAVLTAVVEEEAMAPEQRGELRLLLGRLLVAAGLPAAGRDEQVRSLGELLPGRPDLAAKAMAQLADPRILHDHVDEHVAWLERALSLAAAQADPQVKLVVGLARACTLLNIGDPGGWQAVAEIPWAVPGEAGRAARFWGYMELTSAIFAAGRYRLARSFLDEAEGLADELGYTSIVRLLFTADRLMQQWAMGEWGGLRERARSQAEEKTEIARFAMVGSAVACQLAIAAGDLEEAEVHLRRWREDSDAGAMPTAAVTADAALVRIELWRDRPEAAMEAATAGLERIAGKGVWVWSAALVPLAVEAMIACGEVGEAERLVQAFAAGIRGRDRPQAHAARNLSRGLLAEARGDLGTAARHFGASERILLGLPCPYEAARSAVRRGRCLLAQHDAAAPSILLEALAHFEGLGASGDAARLRRLLRRHKIPLSRPWRGGRQGYGERLSPREEEVAGLAAQGRTNAEMARILFLSPKTVEQHMTSLMRKLGMTSRRELIGRVPAELPRGGRVQR